MTRSIEEFHGKNAVVGCSQHNNFCEHTCHPSEHNYYSIDFSTAINADYCRDITSEEKLPDNFFNRFEITLVENIDWDAYNSYEDKRRSYPKGKNGFELLWNITQDDGYIVISGCPRIKQFRMWSAGKKFIELSRDGVPNELIIIPKNQNLSIEDLNVRLQANKEMQSLINNANKYTYVPSPFAYSTVGIDVLPTLQQPLFFAPFSEEEINTININKKIPEIAELYNAITAFCQYAEQHPGHSSSKYLTEVENKQFANGILVRADIFFKQDQEILKRDFKIFQTKLIGYIQSQQNPLLEQPHAYFKLLANILVALTGVGLILLGIHMYKTHAQTGRYLPLFFNPSEPETLAHQVEKAVAPLKAKL